MPSGVSAETTVSSTPAATETRSGDDDNCVRDLVMQTLPRLSEDEQRIDEAEQRNQADDPDHEIAEPEEPRERHRRAVAAHDLDAEDLLADRLAVPRDVLDGQRA